MGRIAAGAGSRVVGCIGAFVQVATALDMQCGGSAEGCWVVTVTVPASRTAGVCSAGPGLQQERTNVCSELTCTTHLNAQR